MNSLNPIPKTPIPEIMVSKPSPLAHDASGRCFEKKVHSTGAVVTCQPERPQTTHTDVKTLQQRDIASARAHCSVERTTPVDSSIDLVTLERALADFSTKYQNMSQYLDRLHQLNLEIIRNIK